MNPYQFFTRRFLNKIFRGFLVFLSLLGLSVLAVAQTSDPICDCNDPDDDCQYVYFIEGRFNISAATNKLFSFTLSESDTIAHLNWMTDMNNNLTNLARMVYDESTETIYWVDYVEEVGIRLYTQEISGSDLSLTLIETFEYPFTTEYVFLRAIALRDGELYVAIAEDIQVPSAYRVFKYNLETEEITTVYQRVYDDLEFLPYIIADIEFANNDDVLIYAQPDDETMEPNFFRYDFETTEAIGYRETFVLEGTPMQDGNFLYSSSTGFRIRKLRIADENASNTGVTIIPYWYGVPIDFSNFGFSMTSGCMSNATFMELRSTQETSSYDLLEKSLDINPNPTEGLSFAQFSSSREQNATLEIYDMTGRRLALLFNGVMDAEVEYRTEFDGSHLPNGVYIYRFTVGGTVEFKKFIIAR